MIERALRVKVKRDKEDVEKMKRFGKVITVLLALCVLSGIFVGCGDPLAKGKTKVVFWGYAGEDEAQNMQTTIDWYNRNNTDGIYIDYQPQPGGSYVSVTERALASKKGPDVFYLGDRYLKRWARSERGYLVNLQEMVDESGLDMSDWWTSSQYRWRYDPTRNTNNPDDPLYALPKDINSTALYYNASVLNQQGIKIISVDEEDLAAFNAGGEDRYGNTKASLGIDIEVEAKGFYREQKYRNGRFTVPTYGADGKVTEMMIFNNRIAMSWDEIEDLAQILTKTCNANLEQKDYQKSLQWGYYTEWWFNYGWGVGGDCAVDTTGEGDWVFTLGDKTKKRLVYNADGRYATDAYGKALFVADGSDYTLLDGQYVGDPLPSQYEAFERFIKLGKPKAYGGLGVAMRDGADKGLSTSTSFFTSGKVAMLVETADKATAFRKGIDSFEWDVAPLPIYKKYGADGKTVVNQGINVGHSGSTGIGIWTNSKVKDEAFKVAVYLSTGYAQTLQAQNGYLIPNSKTLAESEYVKKNEGRAPKNVSIFTDNADTSRPADWWYMPDNEWIDVWATPLNNEYRENDASVDDFFARFTAATNEILAGYKQEGMV